MNDPESQPRNQDVNKDCYSNSMGSWFAAETIHSSEEKTDRTDRRSTIQILERNQKESERLTFVLYLEQ